MPLGVPINDDEIARLHAEAGVPHADDGLTYDDEDSTPWAEAFWDSVPTWPKGKAKRVEYTALWFDQLQEVGRRHPKAETPKWSRPMGLDEYPEAELIAELEERRARRRRGLCDYCGRPLCAEPFCRMEERHGWAGPFTMSVEQFHAMNVRRCESTTGFGQSFDAPDGWTPADWITAVVGELGELANLLKKRRRGEQISSRSIQDEWADTFTYLDLLAEALEIDPMAVVLRKFDEVSDRMGWDPERADTEEVQVYLRP